MTGNFFANYFLLRRGIFDDDCGEIKARGRRGTITLREKVMDKWTLRTTIELFAMATIMFTLGCSRTVYVPTEHVTHDTVYKTNHRIDTIFAKDSVFIGTRGDTVIKETFKWRLRSRLKTDTVYKFRTDTLEVPLVRKEMAAKAAKTNSFKSKTIALLVCGLLLTICCLYLKKRFGL